MKKEDMIELLKDPDVLAALEAKKGSDTELEELLNGVDISDEDTLETISKKHQQQIGKLVKYFNGKLETVEASAVEKATAGERAKTDKMIQDFHAANPGMKNPEVVAMMQPLFDKGVPIEECYAKACRGLEIDPTTGETPEKKGTDEDAKDKKVVDKATPPTSNRSLISDDSDQDADEDKDKGPISLDDAISANFNAIVAKRGNPFQEKETV